MYSDTICYRLVKNNSSDSPYLIHIKKMHVVTFFFILQYFFLYLFLFLFGPGEGSGRWVERSLCLLLSCASHFRLDSVVHLNSLVRANRSAAVGSSVLFFCAHMSSSSPLLLFYPISQPTLPLSSNTNIFSFAFPNHLVL